MPDVIVSEVFGLRAALVLPTLNEAAPQLVREGIVRRRITMTTGQCPCGAIVVKPNRQQRRRMARDHAKQQTGVWSATVSHAGDCPAVDPTVARWVGEDR